MELALGLLSVREGFVPSVTAVEASDDGGLAIYDESSAALETLDPTGIFFSHSWSGQIAAIVARACSEERKVYGVCVP